MDKKTYIQILLFSILSILIISTFNFYKSDKIEINNKKVQINDKGKSLEETESSNFIENLSYFSKDSFGNQYEINATKGFVSFENKNIIFMTDVNAIITMNNSQPIFIKADFANYNNINYDTFFKGNVFLSHLTHKINSKKLNLFFKTNFVTMYDDLVYKNTNTILYADKFEMNLITKNSKIFMNNESKKINIFIEK
jgi:hypothetical protein